MAAYGVGASGLKLTNLSLGSVRPRGSTFQNSIRIGKVVQYNGLAVSLRLTKSFLIGQCSASEGESSERSIVPSEETVSSTAVSKLIPNSDEVEYLLTELCDTKIAEFELKLAGFHLYVMRDLVGQSSTPSTSISLPISFSTTVEASDSNGSVSSPSLAITKSLPSSSGTPTLLDKAADEGLVIVQSPKVGYFRRSRTIKGKRAPPSCKEKQEVKEGQVICFIEQLGGEIPIEADVSGEVTKIFLEDGEPVGYGDALIAILPSFPGIKKLQ